MGVEKFYQYVYGRRVTLITNHKRLLSIFHPSKETPPMAAARMQRYVLFLGAFDYTVEFRRSQDHSNADVFSRLPYDSVAESKLDSTEVFSISQRHCQ